MTRIAPPPPGSRGLFGDFVVEIICFFTKRALGRVVTPVQVMSHQPGLLWWQSLMDNAQIKHYGFPPDLKELAQIRVATLIGCLF